MAYIALAGLIIAIILGTLMYKAYFNPIVLFVGVFMLGFVALFASDFFDLRLITETVWQMYFISFTTFVIGIIIHRIIPIRIKRRSIINQNIETEKRIYRNEIKWMFIISGVATAIYWLETLASTDIRVIISSLLTTRDVEDVGSIIMYLKMLTIFLSPFVVNYIVEYKEKKIEYLLIIAFTFFANLGYARNVIFYILLLDLFALLYAKKGRTKKISFKWAIYVIAGAAAIRFFTYTQALLNKEFKVTGSFMGIKLSGPIITILSYLSGSLVSTGIYMDKLRDVPFLGFTLRSVMNVLNSFGIIHLDTSEYMPTEFVYIPFRFNTNTLQLYIIKEGGWIWFAIFFFLLGYFVDKLYWDYKKSRNRYSLMLLCLLSLLLVTSLRSYIFTRLDMFLYVIMLVILVSLRKLKINSQTIGDNHL